MAHGTEEAGPNGGEIRMPGAFHVEVVAREDALRLYLLDMQFENPRTKGSSVDATLKQDGDSFDLACSVADGAKAFTCPLPDATTLNEGTLVVDASRAEMPAEPAKYELPLAFGQ
ncbi:MAG: hypothetical protein U5K43_06725 [Halofilum sp. (in: g-proteobacteria)]|nr:hypothetical protein [Halofilum sp. (in: g-proteobacteria)]